MTFEEAMKPIVMYRKGNWQTHKYVKGNNWYGFPITVAPTAQQAVMNFYMYRGMIYEFQ